MNLQFIETHFLEKIDSDTKPISPMMYLTCFGTHFFFGIISSVLGGFLLLPSNVIYLFMYASPLCSCGSDGITTKSCFKITTLSKISLNLHQMEVLYCLH